LWLINLKTAVCRAIALSPETRFVKIPNFAKMETLYKLLDKIKHNPGLYIDYSSVTNLYMFLCGYEYSHAQLNISLSEEEAEFQEFQPWLQERFGVKTSASWARIILLYAINEEEGFNTFFDLLEEFKCDRATQSDQLPFAKTSENEFVLSGK